MGIRDIFRRSRRQTRSKEPVAQAGEVPEFRLRETPAPAPAGERQEATPVSSAPPTVTAPPAASARESPQGSRRATPATPATSSVNINIVGCGQCGANLAAVFRRKPDFLPSGSPEHYPVYCSIFDTNEAILNAVGRTPWNWSKDDAVAPFIIPTLTNSEVVQKLFGTKNEEEERRYLQRISGGAGIGGHPILGRWAAQEFFRGDKSIVTRGRTDVKGRLNNMGFLSGGVVVFNSLTGGTGSGFAPIVTDFVANTVLDSRRLALNVSIIPSQGEMSKYFPRSIITSLHYILKENTSDNVILVDNEQLRKAFEVKNYYEYNWVIREALMPLLLAPQSGKNVNWLIKSIDLADIGRWTREGLGFGPAEFCALGWTSKDLPRRLFSTPPEKYLYELADSAARQTTVELNPQIKPQRAVAVLCGPPEFFSDYLNADAGYHDVLFDCLKKKLSDQLKLDFVAFEGMQKVRLSILMAGVNPPRLKRICAEALGIDPSYLPEEVSLAAWLRNFNTETIENLLTQEIRRVLEGEIDRQRYATAEGR